MVLRLDDVTYTEGAPVELRRFLTPGTPVLAEITEQGVTIRTSKNSTTWRWSQIAFLEARDLTRLSIPEVGRPRVRCP